MGDTRDPSTARYPLEESKSGLHWSFGLRSNSSQSEPSTVARLSSTGHILLSDLRDLQSPFCQTRLNVQQSPPNNDFLNISWAPVLDSCLSVSGKYSLLLNLYFILWTCVKTIDYSPMTWQFSFLKGLMEQYIFMTQQIGAQKFRALSQFSHTEVMICHMMRNTVDPQLLSPLILGISHDQKLFSQQLPMDLYMYGTGWTKSLTDDN